MLENKQDNTKSTIIRKSCPYCGKVASELSHVIDGIEKTVKLQCGHSLVEYIEKVDESWTCESISGKRPFPFQYKTLDFTINSDFRTGIFHEQGVGKTICSLIAIKRFPDKLTPFVVICKSSLKVQWFREIMDWLGIPAQIIDSSSEKIYPNLFKAFIISYDLFRNNNPFDDIPIKLIILDECQQIKNSNAKRTQAIRNFVAGKKIIRVRTTNEPNLPQRERIQKIAEDLIKYHGLFGRFSLNFEDIGRAKLGLCECHATKFGTIEGKITINKDHAENDEESEVIETILHEIAHGITPGAGHKPIWRETALAIGSNGEAIASCNGSVEPIKQFEAPAHVLALSGTPIKNHAGEYFPVLNILHPEIFSSQAQYERDFCDTYSNGWSYKIGGINRYRVDRFKELTSDWIIRYTRDEVLPDLPKVFRKNFFVELGEEVEKAYIAAFVKFQDAMLEADNGNKFKEQGNLITKLNILRHITGIAKIEPVSEFVREFLEDCERKIVLFVHHKDVGLGLYNHISRITNELKIQSPLALTSENSGTDSGTRIDESFKNDPAKRVMIASTLSAGEGKNWQMASDCILVERQWNPANEEQAEGRFPRPGSIAQSISATYAIALGTPDEYLSEIVEKKREICKKTMGNEAIQWDQSSLMKEMCELLMQRGGKKWNL